MAMSFREPNQVKWVGARPAHNGEQVLASATCANATVVVYTVPAGKMLFLASYWAHFKSGDPGGLLTFAIRDDLDALQYWLACGWPYVNTVNTIGMGVSPPIEIPEDWDVYIVSAVATGTIRAGFSGWVE